MFVKIYIAKGKKNNNSFSQKYREVNNYRKSATS